MTPAMLSRARSLAEDRGLPNVTLDEADVTALPYPDASFSIVLSRFTFHHFPEPLGVLKEMVRVCAPGGIVMVIDVQASADPAKADEFNRMEVLRDPSHVRAMPLAELQQLFAAAGLPSPRVTAYELRDELENLLGRSFPESRRRRQDPRFVRSLHRRRSAGHPDPARGPARSLCVSRQCAGRETALSRCATRCTP